MGLKESNGERKEEVGGTWQRGNLPESWQEEEWAEGACRAGRRSVGEVSVSGGTERQRRPEPGPPCSSGSEAPRLFIFTSRPPSSSTTSSSSSLSTSTHLISTLQSWVSLYHPHTHTRTHTHTNCWQLFKGAICKNWPPVKFILKTINC